MADLIIWISGAELIKIESFFAMEGSIFLKLFWLKSAEIRDFSRQEYVGIVRRSQCAKPGECDETEEGLKDSVVVV